MSEQITPDPLKNPSLPALVDSQQDSVDGVEESPPARYSSWLAALLGAAASVVIIAGLRVAAELIVPLLLAIFTAMILSSPLRWLKAKRLPAPLAIALLIGLVLVITMMVAAVVSAAIGDFRQALPSYGSQFETLSSNLVAALGQHGVVLDQSQWQTLFDPSALFKMVANTLSSLGNALTNGLLILLLVVFMLAEEQSFIDKLERSGGSAAGVASLRSFARSVNSYMALKSLISLATGLVIWLWLWLLGVDYAVMWGLLAFLLNFVPNIGSLIAAVPAVLLALLQLGVSGAVIAASGYLAVNFVMGNLIEPRVMGRGLNLSPLVIFLSLLLWGWVLGPVGMLLSVPLTIMLKLALESRQQSAWVGAMLGGTVLADTAVNRH